MERALTSPALREPASWWWRPRAPARRFSGGHFRQPWDHRGQRVLGVFRWHDIAHTSGSANQVTSAYQTPQQLLAIAAAGVALANQTAQQDQYVAALRQAATNAFLAPSTS